jgi:hypothetical protein
MEMPRGPRPGVAKINFRDGGRRSHTAISDTDVTVDPSRWSVEDPSGMTDVQLRRAEERRKAHLELGRPFLCPMPGSTTQFILVSLELVGAQLNAPNGRYLYYGEAAIIFGPATKDECIKWLCENGDVLPNMLRRKD